MCAMDTCYRCVLWIFPYYRYISYSSCASSSSYFTAAHLHSTSYSNPQPLRNLFNVLFYQRCAMLRCCRSVWLSPIIFGTHSLALVETDSAKPYFLHRKIIDTDACYEWLPYHRYIVYLSCVSSSNSYIV
ncbi:hypothetical protein SFRURICE_015472 [Spodoptera frugiperda]|nr:hypothetical protein SFRURICE_015472 [Spodoptera frugiperda]